MIVEKALRWVVIIGVFCLPFVALIVTSSMFFPYITGKNFTFRVIGDIITGAWLALALYDEKYRPRRSWILYAFALFVFVMMIADALGVNPFKSFWSNYERMDGWITLIHTLAYIIVASCVLNTENLWRRLFKWSLVVSAFLSVLGLLQVANIFDIGSGGVGLGGRIDTTFGNPIYLAVYMLFHIFIAALLITQEGKERWSTIERILLPCELVACFALIALFVAHTSAAAAALIIPCFLAIIAMVGLMFASRTYLFSFFILLDTLALFFTGTRGTMLGLIGGASLALLLLAFIQGTRHIRKITVVSLIGLVVITGGLKLAKDTPFVQSVGFLQRLASISLSDSTVKTRFLNMGIAWQGVKERPIFGWGQENYAIVFDKYYDPRLYGAEPWFDRTHNVIFDWLVTGGFLGLFTYLSILLAALWVIWRPSVERRPSGERGSTEASRLHVGSSTFTISEQAIFTGLLAGYFVHNLTVFDNVTSYILFATVLSYIIWRECEAGKNEPQITKKLLPKNSAPFVVMIVAIITLACTWWINAPGVNANWMLLQAVARREASISKNLEYFKDSIAYGAMGTQEVREQLAQIAVQVAGAASVDNSLKQQFLNTADSEMLLQEKMSPLDARFPLFRGALLDAYGMYGDAATALERAHELSPRKQSILFEMAQNAAARGDSAAALTDYKTAFELDTEYAQARLLYAAAVIRSQDDALADQLLAPTETDGTAATPQIAQAYLERKRYDKIAVIWEAHLRASPRDTQGYFTLAAAYYTMGNTAKAIDALQKVETIDPSVKSQADSLIEQVKAGTATVQ